MLQLKHCPECGKKLHYGVLPLSIGYDDDYGWKCKTCGRHWRINILNPGTYSVYVEEKENATKKITK